MAAVSLDLGLRLSRRSLNAEWGQGRRGSHSVVLARPLTYMNHSGQAAAALVRYFKLQPENLLVVLDDFNLPLGQLRLRGGGSAGGHNGLQSIIEETGVQSFPRLRIGIGQPSLPQEVSDFVLRRFAREERVPMREAVARAAEAVLDWIGHGLDHAMRTFN